MKRKYLTVEEFINQLKEQNPQNRIKIEGCNCSNLVVEAGDSEEEKGITVIRIEKGELL